MIKSNNLQIPSVKIRLLKTNDNISLGKAKPCVFTSEETDNVTRSSVQSASRGTEQRRVSSTVDDEWRSKCLEICIDRRNRCWSDVEEETKDLSEEMRKNESRRKAVCFYREESRRSKTTESVHWEISEWNYCYNGNETPKRAGQSGEISQASTDFNHLSSLLDVKLLMADRIYVEL